MAATPDASPHALKADQMLYWLADFSGSFSFLNVFRYITFRTGGAMATAVIFVFLFGPGIIDALRERPEMVAAVAAARYGTAVAGRCSNRQI